MTKEISAAVSTNEQIVITVRKQPNTNPVPRVYSAFKMAAGERGTEGLGKAEFTLGTRLAENSKGGSF